jgi:hypothetical protein
MQNKGNWNEFLVKKGPKKEKVFKVGRHGYIPIQRFSGFRIKYI